MADLKENTQYNNAIGTRLPIANLSGLVKNIQNSTKNTTSNVPQAAITNHFNPNIAGNIFSTPDTQTTSQTDGTFSIGKPIGTQQEGTKYEPIPSYEQFVKPDQKNLWSLPSDQATLRNLPLPLGGGQYVTDPTQRDALIKSERVLVNEKINPGVRKAILGKLPSSLYQVDHMVPLWIGGADTLANLTVLDNDTHAKKTAVQSVPLTLLANNKITLNQAKMMALSWQDKDSTDLPTPDNNGYVPLDIAEKYAKKWETDTTTLKPGKYFKESFKEKMSTFGEDVPILGEFGKGLVGGVTAGIVPSTEPLKKSGTLGTLSNIAGNVLGTIVGLGKFATVPKLIGGGIKTTKSLLGITKAAELTQEVMKTADLVTDIGSLTKKTVGGVKFAANLKKSASTALLLTAWGQLGLVGRELTGQEEFELKNHIKAAAFDTAFGGLLGFSGQNLKGYARVGLGTTALSLMEGETIVPALQNGILMTALHGMGYKKGLTDPTSRIANDEAYKMSVTTFNQYLGDIIPTVKKGQTVPEILKLDIPKIEQTRKEYQQKYPNDQRFTNLEPITNEKEAIDFLERAARRELGNSVAKSNGTIPQEDIKKEMTRIVVAKNQLYNQTLPAAERAQKELADMWSMGEQLRPQIKSDQLRPSINATTLLNKMPVEFPRQVFDNTDGKIFLTGNVPTTGYGDNIDVVSKKTISDYYNNPKGYSEKVFIVKDPETAKIMRLIEQEQIASGQKPNIGNPDHALRVFVKTIDGEIKPAGYMPREVSFDVKKNNLNKTYYEITNRLRHTIESSASPEDLKIALGKDKAQISIDESTAKRLFDNKALLKDMSDEELYSILKPGNAFEKYSSKLNNSAIAEEMDKNGINVLIANKEKVLPVGGTEPRANPENPYLSVKLNEQDWLRSIAMKNGQAEISAPLEKAIKEISAKQKSQNITKTTKKILKSEAVLNKPVLKSPITSQTPSRTAVLAPQLTQETFKTPKTIEVPPTPKTPQKTPLSVKKTPDITTEFYNDIVDRIDSVKPKITSAGGNEKQLMDIIKNFKRKNPGLSENDFKDAMSRAKGRATSYVQNLIDTAWKGTEVFGTSDMYTRQPVRENMNVLVKRYNELKRRGEEISLKPFEKTELKELEIKIKKHTELDKKENQIKLTATKEQRPLTEEENKTIQEIDKQRFTLTQDYQKDQSLVLANKFGLELTEPNEAGFRYLKLDKSGNPIFTEEFKKANEITNQTPKDIWGSFLENEMKVYKGKLSQISKEWADGISQMKKAKQPYAKGFATGLETALEKKYGTNWRTSWKANSALKSTKDWFQQLNEEGHLISQPFRRTAATTIGRNLSDVQKKIAVADIKTKQISEEAALNRINSLATKTGSSKIPEGMRVKDPNQVINVSQDLTPFDIMTNGRLNAEVRKTLVERYNNLRSDLHTGTSSDKELLLKDMQELFTQIKALSINTPEEIKTWKLGSKIELKNNGDPTLEEGIKDAMRLAAKIFQSKKSPGYVEFEDVRTTVLNKLKKDGKGGPYDGQGGFFSDALNTLQKPFSNITTYIKPKETTYDVRGLKITDKDLDEASKIIGLEISNRPGKDKFETHHIVNTAINRALTGPKQWGKTLTEVLQKPAQYQAYAPAGVLNKQGVASTSRYQKLQQGILEKTEAEKIKKVREYLNELKNKEFTDTTGGSTFYVHASDGTLWLGKTIKAAKDAANKHEKQIKSQQTKWGTTSGLPVDLAIKG